MADEEKSKIDELFARLQAHQPEAYNSADLGWTTVDIWNVVHQLLYIVEAQDAQIKEQDARIKALEDRLNNSQYKSILY